MAARTPPARGGTGRDRDSGKASPTTRSAYRGGAGMRQMEEEQKRQEAAKEARKARGFEPFRFWTPVTETRQIVIIDDAPDFFRYEHALKDKRSGRYDNYLPCINEDANCPVCSVSEKPAYFGMYLTVLDLTAYENKDGKEVTWSKKIMVVKPAQQKKIARLFEKHGTTRGMILDMTRDGDKDASIGNDIEFVDFMDEAELDTYYETYKDKEGKTVEIIGSEIFDYDKIYPEMTEKQLATIAGVSDHGTGNRDDDDKAIGRTRGRSSGRDREDDPPARRSASRRDEEPAEDAPRRPARRGSREEEPAEEEAPRRGTRRAREEEDPPEEAPRRSAARRGREEPAEEEAPRRTAARRGREEQAEEDPPQRSARRGREEPAEEDAPRRPAARRGREEPAEEDPPQRGRSSRGRADADHEDPPFEEQEEPANDRAGRRQALRNRRS